MDITCGFLKKKKTIHQINKNLVQLADACGRAFIGKITPYNLMLLLFQSRSCHKTQGLSERRIDATQISTEGYKADV